MDFLELAEKRRSVRAYREEEVPEEVVHMLNNPRAVGETWVQSLGWDDPLEEDMATHSSILAWRIPMDRGAWWVTIHGVAKNQT